MRWHSFLSRLALICNVLFVYCWLVTKTKDFIGNADINSIIIILGYTGPLLNVIVNLCWLFLFLMRKTIVTPKWLLLLNLALLAFQIIVLLVI